MPCGSRRASAPWTTWTKKILRRVDKIIYVHGHCKLLLLNAHADAKRSVREVGILISFVSYYSLLLVNSLISCAFVSFAHVVFSVAP